MNNVLLITIDSLRADHVGYHGYDRDTTPFIDSLAQTGSTFTNAFAHVGGTRFSFPSILSGVTPLMYGGYERISDTQTLVSEVFRAEDYQTAGFTSNLYVSGEFGYNRGFQEFYDSKNESSLTGQIRRFVQTNMQDTVVYPVLQKGYDFLESSQGINIGSYHDPADELTDMAVDFVRNTEQHRPKFLWVHYMDVHHPFIPPEEYQQQFRDSVVGDREAVQLRRKALEEPDDLTEDELATLIDLYDAEIRFNDAEVRRLVETTREEWNGVTIALTADHGEHFLEHGYFSGAQPYDVKLHVPLLVHGWDDDGRYDELVGLVDLPPTLLDVAGLEVPDSYQGTSLRRLVFDGEWNRTEIMGGWGTPDPTYVYRDLRWKYIQRPGNESSELYELEVDPDESKNVADQYPERVEQFDAKLADLKRLIERTETDVDEVEMDEEVKKRLRRLGYQE